MLTVLLKWWRGCQNITTYTHTHTHTHTQFLFLLRIWANRKNTSRSSRNSRDLPKTRNCTPAQTNGTKCLTALYWCLRSFIETRRIVRSSASKYYSCVKVLLKLTIRFLFFNHYVFIWRKHFLVKKYYVENFRCILLRVRKVASLISFMLSRVRQCVKSLVSNIPSLQISRLRRSRVLSLILQHLLLSSLLHPIRLSLLCANRCFSYCCRESTPQMGTMTMVKEEKLAPGWRLPSRVLCASI